MKILQNLALFVAFLHSSRAFMTVLDFRRGTLTKCYDDRRDTRISKESVNGQELPLPSSIETFVSLVERLELKYPNIPNVEFIRRLLISFRVDDLKSDLTSNDYSKSFSADLIKFQKAFFGIPESVNYAFQNDDFTEDEKCALHFMLSHTINETRRDNDEQSSFGETSAKHPRELGVVSVGAKWKQAFALGRVLLGLMAGLMGNNGVKATNIAQTLKVPNTNDIKDLEVNRISAVTIADLVTVAMAEKEIRIFPDGIWNDATCTTEYSLADNNDAYISKSLLRGAIDGLILGKKVEKNSELYTKLPLSQILRMYYGYSGLADVTEDTKWCRRQDIFSGISDLSGEILNFNKLYKHVGGSVVAQNAIDKINNVIEAIRSTVFGETDNEAVETCSISEISVERRCSTPSDIFAILDYGTNELSKIFQQEVLGNLSVSFDMRPSGSKMGVYTNIKPLQNNALDTIINVTGISGCPSCFARYYSRSSSREDDIEVLRDLNQTLTEYEELTEEMKSVSSEDKMGFPAKIALYFNYGNPTESRRLHEAVWEVKKHFREVTVLAIGNKKESLRMFTEDADDDVFTDVGNAANLAKRLKQRICKIPAEFTFKQCAQRSAEADNKQVAYISTGKIQYWAMYPKYFLKSYGIKLKFRATHGAQVKVCFSRYYQEITEGRSGKCLDASDANEAVFYESNPCHRYNEHNCHPFYFSVEGKKSPVNYCEHQRCSTPKDIEFEFFHEGISCNLASFTSVSSMAFFLSLLAFLFLRCGVP